MGGYCSLIFRSYYGTEISFNVGTVNGSASVLFLEIANSPNIIMMIMMAMVIYIHKLSSYGI